MTLVIIADCGLTSCREKAFVKPSQLKTKTGLNFCSKPCLEKYRRQQHHATSTVNRPTSMTEAKRQGVKFYNTGEPCKHGHYADRYSSGRCVACVGIRFVCEEIEPLEVSHSVELLRATHQRKLGRLDEWEVHRQKYPEYCHLPKSVEDARETGVKQYFSGRPCPTGHVVPRYLNTKCSTCVKERVAKWAHKNPEMIAKNQSTHTENHPEYKARRAAWTQKHNSQKMRASPLWLSREQLNEIEMFYLDALALSVSTGIPHEVDHIVPLQGKHVRGLHVPWNLQVITKSDNCRKSNRFETQG